MSGPTMFSCVHQLSSEPAHNAMMQQAPQNMPSDATQHCAAGACAHVTGHESANLGAYACVMKSKMLQGAHLAHHKLCKVHVLVQVDHAN